MAHPSTYNHRALGAPSAVTTSSNQVVGGSHNSGPTGARLADLLDFVKGEFDQVTSEAQTLKAQNLDFEAHTANQISEVQALRHDLLELEREHLKVKAHYEDEVMRLRKELESVQAQAQGRPSNPHQEPLLMPSHQHQHPNAPFASGSAPFSTAPPTISPKSAQAGTQEQYRHDHAGGPSKMHPQPRRDYASPHAAPRERPDGREDHVPAAKRARQDEIASPRLPVPQAGSTSTLQRTAASSDKTGSAPPGRTTPVPAPRPANGGSHSGSGEAEDRPRVSTSARESESSPSNGTHSARSALSSQTPRGGAGTPGSQLPLVDIDPDTLPRDLKKEGSDWLTMFNPKVKRVLDVGLVHTLVHDSVVCCVRFSPDGKVLATGCNRNTNLYDTKTGAKLCVLIDDASNSKADNYIRSACFSPDGKYIATGSEDRIIRIWDLSKRKIRHAFHGHQSEIYSLAFSHDGRTLVSGSGDKTARVWDMDKGISVFTLNIDDGSAGDASVDAGVTSVALSPDGRLLAAGSLDTLVRIWDAQTGRLLDKVKGHKDSVYSVAFAPDGKWLVSGSLDKTLKMWDLSAFESSSIKREDSGGLATCIQTLSGHKDYVLSVAVSPDGHWIVSGSKDRGVQFWDPQTGLAHFMLQGHKNSVISIAVSQVGGYLATGSGDWHARIWSFSGYS